GPDDNWICAVDYFGVVPFLAIYRTSRSEVRASEAEWINSGQGQLSGIPLQGPDAFEKAARCIGEEEFFSRSINYEFIRFRDKLPGRNEWSGHIFLPLHQVDDAIFRDEI